MAFLVMIIVVDDIEYASTNQSIVNNYKMKLWNALKVKLLRKIRSSIEWEIKRRGNASMVNPGKYIAQMLQNLIVHNLPIVDTNSSFCRSFII